MKSEKTAQIIEEKEEMTDIQEKTGQETIIDNFPLVGEGRYIEGIGRRKTATARVRIYDGAKKEFDILINDRDYNDYFKNLELKKIIEIPLRKIKASKIYRVTVKVKSGGLRGQAEAIRLGLARALVFLNSEWKNKFKQAGFLVRDPRMVERKKYGKRKARKEEQWQKR